MVKIFKTHRKGYSQRSWLTFFQYAFVICLILNMNSIWIHSMSTRWANDFLTLVTLGVVLVSVFLKQEFPIKTLQFFILLSGLLTLYLALFYLMDPLKKTGIFKIFLQVLEIFVYCLFVENSKKETLKKFSNIILLIAAVSIFFWIFGSLSHVIKRTGIIYSTWAGNGSLKLVNSYYGVYYETQTANIFNLFSKNLIRNTAIFAEAPMASFVFTIAFLNELLFTEKVSKKRITILVVAILSTMSTTGYTSVVFALGLKYIFTKSETRETFSIKVLLLPITLIIGGVVLNFLFSEKLDTNSGSIRFDDFLAGYKAWLDHPIFGNGFGNDQSYMKYMSAFRRDNLGFSNSLMQILAFGGIYLFIPYFLVTVFAMFNFIKRKQMYEIVFYLVFIYLFIVTVVPFQMLTIYLFISMLLLQ